MSFRPAALNASVTLLFIGSLLLWLTNAHADDKLTIVTESWPPHVYLDKSGQVTGPMKDRVIAIVSQAGLSYNLNLYPWPRTYKIALTEKNVLVFPLFKNPERLERFHFICPFTAKVDLFLYKLTARTDIRLQSLNDAKRFVTGLVRDDHDHIMLKQQGFEDGINIDANADDENSLKKLLKKRIDLMIQSKSSMARLLKRFKLSPDVTQIALQLPAHLTGENCIALSLDTAPHLVEKMRDALERINEKSPMPTIE